MNHAAGFIAQDQGERSTGATVNFHGDRAKILGRVTVEGLPQPAVQLRIARLPQFVTDADPREIDVTRSERQRYFGQCGRLRLAPGWFDWLNFVNTSAFFRLIGRTSVEDNAVAGFQWSVELENDLRA